MRHHPHTAPRYHPYTADLVLVDLPAARLDVPHD
jgi:hypothetical protein